MLRLCALCWCLILLCSVRAGEPLKIAYSDWPGWTAWEIAIQKGWLKEAGIAAEFIWMEYVPSMEAFQAGKVDAVTVTNGDQLVMAAAGKDSRAILVHDYSFGNDMVIGRPGVQSIRDLRGKKVAVEVGFVDHLLLLKALEMNGMKESDITIVNAPTNDMPQILASGEVAAVCAWYPVSGQALAMVPGSKPLFTSREVPGLIYDLTVVDPQSLLLRRAEWAKLVALWPRIVAFIENPATREEAIRIMAARVRVAPEQYATALPGTKFLTVQEMKRAFTPSSGLDSVLGSSRVVHAFNLANKVYSANLDPAKFLEPSLVMELP
ncbi:MAG: ABC transporter substrate-binding protein [Planctomycetota bacterium]|nr:ABC transporter substrate-binding protein [Planctomycetota bacterium]MCX8040042.1 ABC transporter substrate-binding protein [Planctomycetota bacterium]MDW8373836.1 ABC transporter substrate-binding protein [Planctomycetota bacterium]